MAPLKLTVSESAGFEYHEPDEWFKGRIADITETTGQFGDGVKLVIYLDGETNDDGSERETWAYASQKATPRSKIFGWYKAITGLNVEAGGILDLGKLLGARVEVMFERFMGTDRDSGSPVEKEKVVKIRAEKKLQQKAAAAAKKPQRPVDDDDEEAPF